MVSAGGLLLSRESNRFAVVSTDSSPRTSQPRFVDGLSSHPCTSAAICAPLHVYEPRPPTDWLALTLPAEATLVRPTGEETSAGAVAAVTVGGHVLVEGVVSYRAQVGCGGLDRPRADFAHDHRCPQRRDQQASGKG